MSVKIEFSGPMLFVRKGNVLAEVRVPNASSTSAQVPHADGSRANPHAAGILVRMQNEPDEYFEANASAFGRIQITEPASIPVAGCDTTQLDTIVPLHREAPLSATGPLRLWEPKDGGAEGARIAARVELRTGSLHTVGPSNFAWCVKRSGTDSCPSNRKVKYKLRTEWRSRGNSVTLAFQDPATGVQKSFVLGPSDEAYIYNSDQGRPPKHVLQGRERKPVQLPYTDDDFKWLYRLLVRPNGTPVTVPAGERLAAPLTDFGDGADFAPRDAKGFVAANVSTCFSAEWELA